MVTRLSQRNGAAVGEGVAIVGPSGGLGGLCGDLASRRSAAAQSSVLTSLVADNRCGLEPALAAQFAGRVLCNPVNAEILRRLPSLGLGDGWLVAGCLVQAVWNAASGQRAAEHVKDYDLFYFDGDDLSWDAEDRAISRTRAVLADLGIVVDLKNQARVHLWYGERFGAEYPRLTCAQDGIDRFLVAGTCVGLGADASGALRLYAPFGLEDMFYGRLRPNPLSACEPAAILAKAESYRARWPHLTIDPVPAPLPRRDRVISLPPAAAGLAEVHRGGLVGRS